MRPDKGVHLVILRVREGGKKVGRKGEKEGKREGEKKKKKRVNSQNLVS